MNNIWMDIQDFFSHEDVKIQCGIIISMLAGNMVNDAFHMHWTSAIFTFILATFLIMWAQNLVGLHRILKEKRKQEKENASKIEG